MWCFIIDPILPLLCTFLVGALGWWVTNWIAAPITDFENTRRQTREELHFHRHLSDQWRNEQIDEAATVLQRMSARIDGASVTSSGLVRWYFRKRGWDLAKAQSALLGLSNVLGTSADERTILRYEIEVAMGFLPLSDDSGRIERIKARIDQSGK